MRKRIKKFKLVVVLCCFIVLTVSTRVYSIDCCSDPLSCIATIATGGMSCAIQDFINTVKTVIDSVKALQDTITKDIQEIITASKQAVDAAGADLNKLGQMAKSDLDNAVASAQQISSAFQAQNPAATAATVDSTKALDALLRGQTEINKLKPPLQLNTDAVQQAAMTAKAQVDSQVKAATDLATTILLTPLQSILGILNSLLQHPEQIMDPHALVDGIILTVTAQMQTTLNTITDMLVKNANATLDAVRPKAQAAMDQAFRGRQIAQAMQLLAAVRTQAALDQLNALLPLQAVTSVAPTTGTMAGGPLYTGTPAGNTQVAVSNPASLKSSSDALAKIGLVRTKSQALVPKWRSALQRDWDNLKAKQQAVLHPVLAAGIDNAAKSQFDSLLANQDRTRLEASRVRLVAEAKRRFASDPQTLAKVEQLLGQEIDRRIAILPKVPAGPK
jgi:hypothetical protein